MLLTNKWRKTNDKKSKDIDDPYWRRYVINFIPPFFNVYFEGQNNFIVDSSVDSNTKSEDIKDGRKLHAR